MGIGLGTRDFLRASPEGAFRNPYPNVAILTFCFYFFEILAVGM
jgi:hypothetical protein